MHMPEFEHQQRLACSVEALFDFLTRPANQVRLSRPESQLTFLDPPDVIAPGHELEFEVRAYGTTQSVTHEIVAVERPRLILERMLHGPLEELEHEHLFEGTAREAVIVDRIRFTPPGGMIGLLLTEARLRKSFEESFAYRSRILEQLVAEGERT
jgi:ligand-binding SRPBCC domain-containing protein